MTVVRTNRPTKVPGFPKVPANSDPQLRQFLEAIVEAVDIRLGRKGDPTDRAITLRELIESGLAKQLRAAPFDPNAVGPPLDFDTGEPSDSPTAPTGFSAAGAYSQVNIFWDYPRYRGHSQTEIWSHSSDVLGDATLAGISTGISLVDPVGSGVTKYYWARHVNVDGVLGPWNASAGTVAITAPDVEHLLDVLTNSITSSELASSLTTKLDGFEDDIADLETTFGSTAAAATSAVAAAASQAAAIAAKVAALLAQTGAETAESNAVIAKTSAETANASAQTFKNAASQSATSAAGSASSASQSSTTAANSASAANTSASAASTSASSASTFATNAGSAATAASASETAASTSETNSANSASAASTSASAASASETAAGASATAADTSKTSAETALSGAEASETSAATSETNAAGSASSASTSATTAANAATAAGNSATAANTSAQTASSEATAAGQSASAASASQTAASTSSTNAANSAAAASTSAQTATASETAAGQSASSASTHANTASTQAGQASTFASNAATSASNAAGSATSAASVVNGLTARLNDVNDTGSGSAVTVEQAYSATATNTGDITSLEGQYTVKIDANGHVAGFGLANTSTSSGGSTSEFFVNADKFAILPDAVTSADSAWSSGVSYSQGNRVTHNGKLYQARIAHTSYSTRVPPNTVYWDNLSISPFVVTSSGSTIDGTYVPAGVYINSAMIKHATITAAQIGSINANTITSGFINSDRIEFGTLDGDRIETNTLSVGGVAIQDSIGRIAGTAGNDVNMSSYAEVSQTNFVNTAPHHIAAAYHSDGNIQAGSVMGGSPLYSFTFTTFAFTGTRQFVIQAMLDPVGSFSSASSTGFALAMRATSSSSAYTSTSGSSYVTTRGTSRGGSGSADVYTLSDIVTLSPNTQYYIWVFGVYDDVSQNSQGTRGIRDGQISVMGLNR